VDSLRSEIVFLFDVDNTLLDNDRVIADLRRYLTRAIGAASTEHYFRIFEQLREELGYADYLGALQRYRLAYPRDPWLLAISSYLVNYPFANRLLPGSLDVLERFGELGPTVILTDGDVVFQPRKIEWSGLGDAVEGRVLVYIHKERELDDVAQRFPADHYVLVDDKLHLLAAVKKIWGPRVTTVFIRQGHYAHDPEILASNPPADVTVERIGDLLDYDFDERGTESMTNPTGRLQQLGQSIWLDNITREMLHNGTLKNYIRELSVTGLTSNPTIFDHAIGSGGWYDTAIHEMSAAGLASEAIFFGLAGEDLIQAADLFRPIHRATNHMDGWVSLEVSPLLANDTARTLEQVKTLHRQLERPNIFIKIPGTPEGLPAIEEATFKGIPINITLLFSREQYLAAARAYQRGIERRIEKGLNPDVVSVASVFISRWDKAVQDKVPAELRNRLGIAIAGRTYRAYRELLDSHHSQCLADAGSRHQRLLWASTGTKDPRASDVLYVEALAAPDTINTMPDATLLALADHGKIEEVMPEDGGDAEAVIAEFERTGVDVIALADQLQREGAEAFVKSWNGLLERIAAKSEALAAS
jgi:transaldolase